MPRFQDIVTDNENNGLPGAIVTVRDYPSGNLSTLTADGGGQLNNPIVADANGAYYFNAANAIYSLEFRLLPYEPAREVRLVNLGNLVDSVTLATMLAAYTKTVDFADSTTPAKGAGLTAFNSALSYVTGTVGAFLKSLITTGGASLIGAGTFKGSLFQYDSFDGSYQDRQAIITITRRTLAPTIVVPSYWSLHVGDVGDNATFKGVSGGFVRSDDPTGITNSQRNALYGWQVAVKPTFSRNHYPYDDATGVIVSNPGNGTGTEAVYVGRTPRAFAGTGYITAGVMTILTVTGGSLPLVVGTYISGGGAPAGLRIASYTDLTSEAGGVGNYNMNQPGLTLGSSGSPVSFAGDTNDWSAGLGLDCYSDVGIYATGHYNYLLDACYAGPPAVVRTACFRSPNNVPINVYRNAAGTANLTGTASLSDNSFIIGDPGAPYVGVNTLLKCLNALTVTGGSIGYGIGVGGAVTQATNKSTAVTINKVCGQITLNNAALAGGANVTFTVNNSGVVSTDTIILNLQSGQATPGTYDHRVSGVGSGTFNVTVENRSGGSLSEALIFNFTVLKGVIA